jgi:cytochrome c553
MNVCTAGGFMLVICTALSLSVATAAERTASVNFILHCSGCHGTDGHGLGGSIPDFSNFIGAFAHEDDGRTYLLHVPGVIGANLSDGEIAAVINYVMKAWGGTSLEPGFTEFTAEEVALRRARHVEDVVVFRRQIVERLTAAGIATAPYPWP